MALSATIYKVNLSVSDMIRHVYQDFPLTLALHPSETEQRMMMRLLAFALCASEQLEFTKGLSTDDEPDLWQKDLSGHIERWIELGQPDEKRIRKACAQADEVVIVTYQARAADIWWKQIENKLQRFNHLKVISFNTDTVDQIAQLSQRNMQLQITIDEEMIWLNNGETNLELAYYSRR